MKIRALIDSAERTLELEPPANGGGSLTLRVDGRRYRADVVEVEPGLYSILIEGRSLEATLEEAGDGRYRLSVGGRSFSVRLRDPRKLQRGENDLRSSGPRTVSAAMPGKVVRTLVAVGERVERGQGLAIIEAMKMQNEIKAPTAGTVIELPIEEGGSVAAGETLAVIE